MTAPAAVPATAQQCAKRVFSGARWDMRGHPCGINASVQEDGQWWCKKHSPTAVAAKQDAWEAAYEAKNKASEQARKDAAEHDRRANEYPRLEAERAELVAALAKLTSEVLDDISECKGRGGDGYVSIYARVEAVRALLAKVSA